MKHFTGVWRILKFSLVRNAICQIALHWEMQKTPVSSFW
jgi:hypothetical protein